MKTIIVWFRNDLRIHDLPSLHHAASDGDRVVPVFIFDEKIYASKRASANRNRFLLESLQDLKTSLKKAGADLLIREGKAKTVLADLAKETNALAVYYTADYTPYAIKRDKEIHEEFSDGNIEIRAFPGRLIVSKLDTIRTKSDTPHKVFTPFWKAWSQIGRRELASTPRSLQLPANVTLGTLPSLSAITNEDDLSPDVIPGGETAALKRFKAFVAGDIATYKDDNNMPALDGTSRLSSYLHFGCISPLYIETELPNNAGARAWHRQLAWREFYHYILLHNPTNTTQEFQEKYRALQWPANKKLLAAWQQGKTGYPMVDAAMRQLNKQGWMHNRARLIVGSFLTKDLWLNWREGEAYFMRMLLDGDTANNNGNWQWIASVGVDPAPVYRRLYNPASQQKKFDPDGAYVKQFVPELANVPDKYLAEPWTMPEDVQKTAKCVIGTDYPEPIVDHKEARLAALEQYRSV